jgi:hypothetical protein
MTPTQELRAILDDQTLDPNGPELAQLERERRAVSSCLHFAFPGAGLELRIGGSLEKGTLVKAAYDLDLLATFHEGETIAGDTLKEIYENVAAALRSIFEVTDLSRTAIRLAASSGGNRPVPLKVEVIPGRFSHGKSGESRMYQTQGEKGHLKTDIDAQIRHVVRSGRQDALRIMKLVRLSYGLRIKQFVLDLLVIESLKGKAYGTLDAEVRDFMRVVVTSTSPPSVEDAGNPYGNDLSPLLNETVWRELQGVCRSILNQVDQIGWAAVLGVESPRRVAAPSILTGAAGASHGQTKPWSY